MEIVKKSRDSIARAVFYIFSRILGEKLSPKTKEFVGNLSFVTSGTVALAAVMAVVQIVAGRVIGPEEYGKVALVVSVGSALSLFCMVGIDSACVYYLSSSGETKRTISAAFSALFLGAVVIFSLALVSMNVWSSALSLNPAVASFGVLYAALSSLQKIHKAVLRGLGEMKRFALNDILSALVAAVVFVAAISFHDKIGFRVVTFTQLAIFISFSLATAFKISPYIGKPSFTELKKLYAYGLFIFWGSLGMLVLTQADRLIVNYFLGPERTGLYSGYLLASNAVIFQLYSSLAVILFPVAARAKDKAAFVRRATRSLLRLAPAFYLLCFGANSAVIVLLGRQYPYNIYLVALFSLAAVLYVAYGIYGQLLGARGPSGARRNSLYILISAVFFLVCSAVLTPRFGLFGAAAALTAASATLAALQIKTLFGKAPPSG